MAAPLAVMGRNMLTPKLIPAGGETMPYPPPPAAASFENGDLPAEAADVNEMESSDEEYQDPRPFQQVIKSMFCKKSEVAGQSVLKISHVMS